MYTYDDGDRICTSGCLGGGGGCVHGRRGTARHGGGAASTQEGEKGNQERQWRLHLQKGICIEVAMVIHVGRWRGNLCLTNEKFSARIHSYVAVVFVSIVILLVGAVLYAVTLEISSINFPSLNEFCLLLLLPLFHTQSQLHRPCRGAAAVLSARHGSAALMCSILFFTSVVASLLYTLHHNRFFLLILFAAFFLAMAATRSTLLLWVICGCGRVMEQGAG